MLFDKLCGIAEHQLPEMVGYLKAAKIFSFPYRPHDQLPSRFTGDTDWMADNFFLPFDVIAIEDTASLIILINPTPGLKGLAPRRFFIEAMSPATKTSEFKESKNIDDDNYDQDPSFIKLAEQGFLLVSMGFIEDMVIVRDGRAWTGAGSCTRCCLVSKNRIDIDHIEKASPTAANGPISNAYTAVQECCEFIDRDKFILEQSPLKIKAAKSKKAQSKIRRSNQRPQYTILTPKAIREKLGIAQKRSSPVPHDRRAHERLLTSPRFKAARGKTIVVRSSWVGPSEATIGNKRYKVLLEK